MKAPLTAEDRAARYFAIKTMAVYFLAFCLGALFAVLVGAAA